MLATLRDTCCICSNSMQNTHWAAVCLRWSFTALSQVQFAVRRGPQGRTQKCQHILHLTFLLLGSPPRPLAFVLNWSSDLKPQSCWTAYHRAPTRTVWFIEQSGATVEPIVSVFFLWEMTAVKLIIYFPKVKPVHPGYRCNQHFHIQYLIKLFHLSYVRNSLCNFIFFFLMDSDGNYVPRSKRLQEKNINMN